MKTINWKDYEGPYKKSITEIPKQLEYIFTSEDPPDQLDLFLYTELAENIKHQYRVYNIIEPVLESFDDHFKHHECRIKNEILFFLDYLFSEFIRDENIILTTPAEYGVPSSQLSKIYPDEYKSYKRFKNIYFDHYHDGQTRLDKKIELYYDSLFEGTKLDRKINDAFIDQSDHELFICAMIALGFYNFKRPDAKLPGTIDVKYPGNQYVDLGLAINKLPFDEAQLKQLLRSEEEIKIFWGGGSLPVLSGCAYTISGFNRSVSEQKKIIDDILESFEYLKNRYDPDFEIQFPPHITLLEDVSSILFESFYGSHRIISESELNKPQQYFFNAVAKEVRTHTYSMLRAGLLPLNMNIEQVSEMIDIHTCYDEAD